MCPIRRSIYYIYIYDLFARHLSADANALSQTNKNKLSAKLRKVTPHDECVCVRVSVCVGVFVYVYDTRDQVVPKQRCLARVAR